MLSTAVQSAKFATRCDVHRHLGGVSDLLESTDGTFRAFHTVFGVMSEINYHFVNCGIGLVERSFGFVNMLIVYWVVPYGKLGFKERRFNVIPAFVIW